MERLMLRVLFLAALSATTGCASVYRVSESTPEPEDCPAVPSALHTRKPVVSVKAAASVPEAEGLADSLRRSTEGCLAACGFLIAPESKPDSVVSLSVSRREAATLSEWFVYEGKVDVRVEDAATGALVANSSIAATGERGLGVTKAEYNLNFALSVQLQDWLRKNLAANSIVVPAEYAPERSAVMVTLSPVDPSKDADEVLLVQRRFMDSVRAHPGIVSCRLSREIPASRAFIFRVEYYPDQFPGGLLNTLVLDKPKLGNNVKLEIVR